ncbi:S1 family peptidase [Bacillus shivajii]|uniref:S1 family peptidase n=1 Tax=Bacillus shivajii TaxID=1983719 RepID=UPI001CFB793D|nr:S1 family peptidase [Bacillus shivajii]UCZ52118.1 S1 family peptidase [Bacillus shivajii]
MPHLSKKEIEAVKKVKSKENEDAILRKQNVIGLGIGVKKKSGKYTGRPALIAYVTSKKPLSSLTKEDKVPESLDGVETDVIEISQPEIQLYTDKLDDLRTLPTNELTTRVRPVKGGWSVGHPDITAGTAGAIVYSKEEGNQINYYILSNNHVLANSNAASLGDPVIQPGTVDGGRLPDDQVATLSKFIPIDLTPDKPLEDHENLVDAAIAEGSLQELDRDIYWNGYLKGWVNKEDVEVGMQVKKTGRTTGYTIGEIVSVGATIDVNFGNNRVARFTDQILTTPLSEGGDSGSVVTDMNNKAIGLLFAGSPEVTILNQIENVKDLLNIEFV